MSSPTPQPETNRPADFVRVALVFGLLAVLVGIAAPWAAELLNGRSAEIDLQLTSQRAVERMRADVARSGVVEINGLHYPRLVSTGALPAEEASEGSESASRGLVLAFPIDEDEDGIPDVDGAGRLGWSEATVTYALVPRSHGIHALVRRVHGGKSEELLDDVERLEFEIVRPDGAKEGLFAVKMQMLVRAVDDEDQTFEHRLRCAFPLWTHHEGTSYSSPGGDR